MPRFIIAAFNALVGFAYLPAIDLLWVQLRECRWALPAIHPQRRHRRKV